jgi:hypothetical protein
MAQTSNVIQYFGLDKIIYEKDKLRESYVHDLIINEETIQEDIMNILGLKDKTLLELIHEDKYINGITADFTLKHNNKIRAIIECKAGDIGVTDFVRGIGQVLQYEYFFDEKISLKGYSYDDTFNTILLFPSSVVKNNLLNIGRFKYPETTILIEINDSNKVTRLISKGELESIGEALDEGLLTVSQYYIRDNRLFELFILLKYLIFLKIKGELKISRNKLEKEKLKPLNTPNSGNWRNAFISLSSLGLIDSSNSPTPSGIKLGHNTYEDFLYMMYESYIKPYIDEIMNYFSDPANLSKNIKEICIDIKRKFADKDVMYLTQSDGRYLSSWLNILRDDYGCIDFLPRSQNRKINYDISSLKKNIAISNIKKFTKSNEYLSRFNKLTQQ